MEAHPVISFRGAETHIRSILKAVSWRTLGTLYTFAISWFLTGRVEVAGSIAGLEIPTKIVWYYLHERLGTATSCGRPDRSSPPTRFFRRSYLSRRGRWLTSKSRSI